MEAIAGKHQLNITFSGRSDGSLPRIGELNPDLVRNAVDALVNAEHPNPKPVPEDTLPVRDLTFCAGCPHRATFYLLKKALKFEKNPGIVIGDIGCYIMSSQASGFWAYQACNCMAPVLTLPRVSDSLHPTVSTRKWSLCVVIPHFSIPFFRVLSMQLPSRQYAADGSG